MAAPALPTPPKPSAATSSPKSDKRSMRERLSGMFKSLQDAITEATAEEQSELIQYQTMATFIGQLSTSLTAMSTLVQQLITTETETPAADEVAEEEIETAQLESLMALCFQMFGTLNGIISISSDLLRSDDETGMYFLRDRFAKGARHSKSDQENIQTMHDMSVQLGAECSTAKDAAAKAASSNCGCASSTTTTTGGQNMTRAERIAALMTNEHNPLKSQKALDAVDDATLAALETHCENHKQLVTAAAAQKPAAATAPAAAPAVASTAAQTTAATQTEAQWLAAAPQSIRDRFAKLDADEAEEKTRLLTALKGRQTEYSDDQLTKMSNAELARLCRLLKVDQPTIARSIDFSAVGLPRAATTAATDGQTENVYTNPPDAYDVGIKANAAALKAQKTIN